MITTAFRLKNIRFSTEDLTGACLWLPFWALKALRQQEVLLLIDVVETVGFYTVPEFYLIH